MNGVYKMNFGQNIWDDLLPVNGQISLVYYLLHFQICKEYNSPPPPQCIKCPSYNAISEPQEWVVD